MTGGIKVLTLDLDDTLWDVRAVIGRAEEKLSAWFDEHHPALPAMFGPRETMALRHDIVRENPARSHDFRFLRRSVYERMAEHADYDAEFIDEALALFDRWRNTVTFFADSLPALENLARAFPIIALTNGNADLDQIGIARHFAGHVSSMTAGVAKPAAGIFDYAAQMAGVSHEEILHVGDDPTLDVAGAQAVGMRTAWVNRRDEEWPAELVRPEFSVNNLSELWQQLQGAAER